MPASRQAFGEIGILGEESVAGVNRISANFLGEGDDAIDIEIGANRFAGFAEQVGFVGFEAMKGEAIFVGVDRDGANAEFMRGAEDANGDFAAVGDEEFFDGWHGYVVGFVWLVGG